MKEFLLVLVGWFLGFISTLISDYKSNREKRGKIARALQIEVSQYVSDMEQELLLLKREHDLPSLLSPLTRIKYSGDFFNCYMTEFVLLNPETVIRISKFYRVTELIERDRARLIELIIKGERDMATIGPLLESQKILREEMIQYGKGLLTRLEKEGSAAKSGVGGERGKMKIKYAVIFMVLILIIGVAIGVEAGKRFQGRESKYEIIASENLVEQGPQIIKLNKISGETWCFQNGQWNTIPTP